MNHFFQSIEGWFSFPNYYSSIVKKFPSGSHFIEIGCWKGKSASFMGVEIVNSKKNIQFDCIDTWDWIEQNDIPKDRFAGLYDSFIKNIQPIRSIINPIQRDSVSASFGYKDNSIDFIFIDASHDYHNFMQDLIHWSPKIKEGGILAGHDIHHTDIKRALSDFFVDKQWVNVGENVWEIKM